MVDEHLNNAGGFPGLGGEPDDGRENFEDDGIQGDDPPDEGAQSDSGEDLRAKLAEVERQRDYLIEKFRSGSEAKRQEEPGDPFSLTDEEADRLEGLRYSDPGKYDRELARISGMKAYRLAQQELAQTQAATIRETVAVSLVEQIRAQGGDVEYAQEAIDGMGDVRALQQPKVREFIMDAAIGRAARLKASQKPQQAPPYRERVRGESPSSGGRRVDPEVERGYREAVQQFGKEFADEVYGRKA